MHTELPLTTTSHLHVPELEQYLEVLSAITSADGQRLQALQSQAPDLPAFLEDVHHCIGHATFDVRMGRRGLKLDNHAALWLMPIVTHHGYSAPERNQRSFQEALHGWFGRYHAISTLEILPVVESVADLSPTDTFSLIQFLLQLREDAPFEGSANATSFPHESLIPTLRFMVGTISRINELPSIPGDSAGALLPRLEREMQFHGASDKSMLQGRGLVLGRPESFACGFVSGYLLWLDEMERDYEITGWTMDPIGNGTVRFTLSGSHRREEGHMIVLPFSLPMWLIGAEGYERIVSRYGSWPLQTSFSLNQWESTGPSRLS